MLAAYLVRRKSPCFWPLAVTFGPPEVTKCLRTHGDNGGLAFTAAGRFATHKACLSGARVGGLLRSVGQIGAFGAVLGRDLGRLEVLVPTGTTEALQGRGEGALCENSEISIFLKVSCSG